MERVRESRTRRKPRNLLGALQGRVWRLPGLSWFHPTEHFIPSRVCLQVEENWFAWRVLDGLWKRRGTGGHEKEAVKGSSVSRADFDRINCRSPPPRLTFFKPPSGHLEAGRQMISEGPLLFDLTQNNKTHLWKGNGRAQRSFWSSCKICCPAWCMRMQAKEETWDREEGKRLLSKEKKIWLWTVLWAVCFMSGFLC